MQFITRLKSLFRASALNNDFSVYINKLEKIAPLTLKSLGNEKINTIFGAYFKELIINPTNTEENIYYLPIFLKKYAKKFDISNYIVEISDYEFSCYQILNDPSVFIQSHTNDLTAEVYTNPSSQALQLEHDIREYEISLKKGKASPNIKPAKKKNLLIISKNPDSKSLLFIDAKITHAAILDELHEGKLSKKNLIQILQNKYQDIPQRDWIVALKDLKTNYVIIEA